MDEVMDAIFAHLVDRDHGEADELERSAGIESMEALDQTTILIKMEDQTTQYLLTLSYL